MVDIVSAASNFGVTFGHHHHHIYLPLIPISQKSAERASSSYASCKLSVGLWRLKWRMLWSRHLWVAGWIIATHFLPALPTTLSVASSRYAATRLVSGARRHDHITPILQTLHWLRVRQRVIFKTAVMVWKCLHDAAPRYLADLCVPAASTDGRGQSRSPGPPGALDSDVYWPAQLCCVWLQDLEATTNGPPTCRSLHSSASSRPTRSSTRQYDHDGCSCGCRVHRPAQLWLYSEFGAVYKCPDSTRPCNDTTAHADYATMMMMIRRCGSIVAKN